MNSTPRTDRPGATQLGSVGLFLTRGGGCGEFSVLTRSGKGSLASGCTSLMFLLGRVVLFWFSARGGLSKQEGSCEVASGSRRYWSRRRVPGRDCRGSVAGFLWGFPIPATLHPLRQ